MATTTKNTTTKTTTTEKVVVNVAKKPTTKMVKKTTTKAPARELSAPIYTMAGKESGTIALPETLFGIPWKSDLVHQVVTAMRANARPTVANTKTRGEVRGGGKKPWKQKGTGRARHGSIRSPIWRGGGVTHGPRTERSYQQKINRKMRNKALAAVLSRKWRDGEVFFVDTLSFDTPKTKDAKSALNAIAKAAGTPEIIERRNNATLVLLSSKDRIAEKSLSNFGNLLVEEARNINPVDVLSYRYLLIEKPAEVLKMLEVRTSTGKV